MKFGVHTFLWTRQFNAANLDLLPRLKEKGFDGIEIARYQFENFPAARIGAAAQQHELSCTLCCGLTGELSLISEDAAVRQRAISFIKQAIQVAADLGSRSVSGPLCAPINHFTGRRRTQDEWQRAVEGLQAVGDLLTQNDMTLAIEPLNRYQTHFLNTTADVTALCEAVNHPNIGVLFDIFHANIEDRDLPGAIRTAGQFLKHVHLCENDRGTPGTGHIPWSEIFAALRDIRYDRWLVIESFNFLDEEIAAMTRSWRDLAPTPEDIAFEGLAFLKQLAQRNSPQRHKEHKAD
jgi:D-psicose/D-tagatose/L-ribulose 3-epimerase